MPQDGRFPVCPGSLTAVPCLANTCIVIFKLSRAALQMSSFWPCIFSGLTVTAHQSQCATRNLTLACNVEKHGTINGDRNSEGASNGEDGRQGLRRSQ